MDYSIKIGGEAGQGIQTVGGTLARIFARAGYHVFSHQDYESRIRGGHNFYQIRVTDHPVYASREKIDIIVALDKASIDIHAGELTQDGMIIYDSEFIKKKYEGEQFLDIPFSQIAEKETGNKIMANTVAVGAVTGMLGMNPDIPRDTIKYVFRKKPSEIIEGNLKALNAGYSYAREHCRRCTFNVSSTSSPLMLIAGNDAIGLGAIASGVRFYAAYPMTPSTGIMNYIAAHASKYGIVVEQAEDEIAAINMAIGASFGGIRAMTGSSGGGFALMVEGLSLIAMTETPIVIALAQRPGPATGLPTRTEQADLLFAIHTAHGEFPRVVFAPGSPEQAFYLTNKAFDIAEKYQIPVIIITDQYLADSQWTYEGFDTSKIIYNDYRLRGEEFQKLKQYKRHQITDSGISPLGVPGESSHLVITDSDEHDEEGHLIEDSKTRCMMVEKRLFKKFELIKREMSKPLYYGAESPDVILTGWGSSYGILKEAIDILSGQYKIGMFHFSEIYPFPEDMNYIEFLKSAKISICIENNATGQFARLLRAETGLSFTHKINRYDGRPFLLDDLVRRVDAIIRGV